MFLRINHLKKNKRPGKTRPVDAFPNQEVAKPDWLDLLYQALLRLASGSRRYIFMQNVRSNDGRVFSLKDTPTTTKIINSRCLSILFTL